MSNIYELLFEKDLVQIPRIIAYTSIIPLIILLLSYLLFDNLNYKKIRAKIPDIINLTQRIENINLNIRLYMERSYMEIDQIHEKITENTQLNYNKFIFLSYIEELEKIQEDWDYFHINDLLKSTSIKNPYIIAYQIREIIATPIEKDDDNEDFIWLSDDEKKCMKKHEHFYHEGIFAPEWIYLEKKYAYLQEVKTPPIDKEEYEDFNKEIDDLKQEKEGIQDAFRLYNTDNNGNTSEKIHNKETQEDESRENRIERFTDSNPELKGEEIVI
jgi:hypothetical protein